MKHLLLCFSLVVPSPAAAQSVDAVLAGVVRDDSRAVVPGATVTVLEAASGLTRFTVTDESGRYVIRHVPPGTYDIRVELGGFAPSLHVGQVLHVGTEVELDVRLSLAGVAEQVTVHGRLPPLESSGHTLTRIVQSQEIDALPLINRNFNDLAALAPGVTKTGVYGGVDISGGRDFQNAYYVDGMSAERHHLGDQRVAYAQDWIQEFQVMTAQFNAEFGQAAGGVVNVLTRSGTNDLKGRAYMFVRDDALDARPAFATATPPLTARRAGATLGGPLVVNRVFYFAGVERFTDRSENIVHSTFPSANGAFESRASQVLSLIKVETRVTPAHTSRVRFNRQQRRTLGANVGGIDTREHGRFSETQAHDLVGSWTSVLPREALHETRAAWSASTPRGGCTFAAENPGGPWFELSYPGARFGCPVNFGTIAEHQFQIVDNVSWTAGRHQLKAGAQLQRTRSSGDFRNFRDGRYSFERDIPFSLERIDSHPFAFSLIEGPTAWDVSGTSAGAFIQDGWMVTNALTINAGLRYDLDGALTALNTLVRTDRGFRALAADRGNVAPRAGVAWTPLDDNRRVVVRAGAGLYHDQNHNNVASAVLLNNILVDRVVAINANNPLLNPFWPDVAAAKRVLALALARNTVPDVSGISAVASATNSVDEHLQIPMTRQASAGVAGEIRSWLSGSVDVVRSRGVDLYVIRDVNIDPVTLQRRDRAYTAVTSFGNGGWSRYTGLHIQMTAMPSVERLLKVAYTLATSRSNTSSTLSTGVATNPFDYAEDEGPTNSDVRHAVALNGIIGLPLRFQVAGIFTYQGALPYSATTNAARPDGQPFGFRPEPRNGRRGDSVLSLDLRLVRAIDLGRIGAAELLLEVFNATNTVNYGDVIGTVTSSRFGEPTTAGPPRRMQVGVRVDF